MQRIGERGTRPGNRMTGFAGQHACERCLRDGRVAVLVRDLAKVDRGLGVRGQQRERLLECAPRVVATLQPHECYATIVVGLSEVRLEEHGAIQCGEGGRGAAGVDQRETEVAVRHGVRRDQVTARSSRATAVATSPRASASAPALISTVGSRSSPASSFA